MSYNFAHNQSTFNKPSTFGLSPNAAALISYIWIPVTSAVVLVTEKENRFVRFHAFQSLFLMVLGAILGIVLLPIYFVGVAVDIAIGFPVFLGLVSLIGLVVGLGFLVLTVLAALKGFNGEIYKIPIVGNFAEKYV